MFIKSIFAYLGDHLWVFVSVICVFAGGFATGYLHEHDKLVSYKSKVEQAAADQAHRVEQIIKNHQSVKEDIHNDYETKLSRLHSDYERRLRQARASSMCATSNATSRTDGTRRTVSGEDLIERCQEIQLQLRELQDWVRKTR